MKYLLTLVLLFKVSIFKRLIISHDNKTFTINGVSKTISKAADYWRVDIKLPYRDLDRSKDTFTWIFSETYPIQ